MMFRKTEHGFTLVELSVVLIIIGLILGSVASQLKVFKQTQQYEETRDKLILTDEGLREFLGANSEKYPCPADPSLPPTNANYGISACDPAYTGTPIACPNLAGPIVCTNNDTRDADGDGVNDFVFIGAFPFNTVANAMRFSKFAVTDAFDAWDMQLSYTVTALLTDEIAFGTPGVVSNFQLGAVNVVDEFDQPMTTPPSSAHYAIFSHGENSVGARNIGGANLGGCVNVSLATPAPIGASNPFGAGSGIETDKENCDNNDGKFVDGLASNADNDSYYDDVIIYSSNIASRIWRESESGSKPIAETWLYNTNLGGVGVGVNDSTVKLDVVGDVRADNEARAEDLAGSGYCDFAGNNCVRPDFIGGTAVPACPSGEAVVAIDENNIVCQPIFTSAISFNCPTPGEFVRSFSNLGNIVCDTP